MGGKDGEHATREGNVAIERKDLDEVAFICATMAMRAFLLRHKN